MKAQERLEAYLGGFRQRLRTLILARGAAALCAAALAVTLLAVYIGTRQAFPAELMNGARLLLALSLGAIAVLLLVRPLKALRRTRGVADIERRAPDFDGRIETYDELASGKRQDAAQPSPFLGLLAEDAWRLARGIPAALRVPGREITVPGALAGAALAALVWFAAFGPDNWRYGVRHVWAGWVMADTLPPQRIVVSPGDGAVRRGGDLVIDAYAQGFDPVAAEVFARFESSEDWESAPMLADDGLFEFTFFAVREPVSYYVVAAGVHSEEFQVDVVDLPRVRNVALTYHYPRWTQLETETEDPGDDISAVAGTRVEVEVTTDQPLGEAELIVNGETLEMTADGAVATGVLEVSESGEYYVSTYFADDPVRLTDDYFIDVIPDNKPEVSVVRPGRDWRASNIEEVSVRVEARDDFGLDRLELHYSVNGGEYNVVELGADGAFAESDEVLYLEEMEKPASASVGTAGGLEELLGGDRLTVDRLDEVRDAIVAGVAEGVAEDAADATSGLEPGDLITYYAVAHDRDASERTDLFFVEVQPFERSYTQSMQGGGGGGGGGGEQNEISQRQKEILLATWNLIREQEQVTGFLDEQQLEDNAAMLSELQRTLADQARTLANRTRARQLTRVDEQIQTFVNSLESAAEAMVPAAERLADLQFDEAVPSEQAALQHLLKAESVFTDIQVSFNQGGGGGGAGGFAGRDLAELFELEMDLEKNQYETESAVSFDTPEAEFDEAIAKLQELARRQENLARQAGRQQQMTEQERWQQEQLRRETEELRRQLEELRQAAAQQQAQQQGQQGGQPQSGQGGQQPGQPGELANAAGEAIRQLDNALQAMDRAQAQGEMTPEQAQRAIEQARRQLDRALEQLTDQRQAVAEAAFSELHERAEALLEDQRRIAAELQQVANEAFRNRNPDGTRDNPLSYEEAVDLSERKWAMQEVLEALEQDIQAVANQFRGQTPEASEELYQALADLQQNQTSLRLGAAADRIRRGLADELAPFEGVTTASLEDLRSDTERALATASREAREGQQVEEDATSELVAELQALRRELAAFQNGMQPGQPGQPGQVGQPGENGQAGGAQPGGQQAGGALGGNRFGPGGGWGAFDQDRRGLGFWDPTRGLALDPQMRERLEAELQAAGSDLLTLGARLRAEDALTAEELAAIRQLGDALRQGLTAGANEAIVEQEYLAMLNLMEQLELQLTSGESGEG
ncbi:MAG: hypothetical protein OXI74_02920, partial [Rhodospirillaceae bacterium]|nr:hypothetical protein [Rhodospirillaceae bacterium]